MERDLERQFQDIYLGVAKNWGFVQALQECFEVSSPSIAHGLTPYLDRSIRETMGGKFPQHFDAAAHPARLKRMAEDKIALARSAIDSASIVIIHAALDEAVNDYLLLIATAEPTLWETNVREETVPMKTIKQVPYADLLLKKALDVAKASGISRLRKKWNGFLGRAAETIAPYRRRTSALMLIGSRNSIFCAIRLPTARHAPRSQIWTKFSYSYGRQYSRCKM